LVKRDILLVLLSICKYKEIIMLAMVLKAPGKALELTEVAVPVPNADQVLIKITACAVCRTDLHILDGELAGPTLPLIPGHQIVGRVVQAGTNVTKFKINDRVGIGWLGFTCGTCEFCSSGKENLCDHIQFTGYNIDGGFAEYCVVNANKCFLLPECFSDTQVAPLLCAGSVGFRAYKKISNAKKIGIYGFGSAAHILLQVALFQHKQIYAFTREGDQAAQEFASKLGATWAGYSSQMPPELLDAAIIFAPVGELIPKALAAVKKGGIVVCGGIHMSEIPAFSYDLLWGERVLCSVANLTHQDGVEFLELAPQVPITTEVTTYSLPQANQALEDLRHGIFNGSAVILLE
jgi:propanol-preferring alcohol dehydrogenase